MSNSFSFSTDTATLSIFDFQAIKHRINDTADWWSLPEDEINEVNKGNIIFLGLLDDGVYKVDVVDKINDPDGTLFLKVPSGEVFIGAGEDTTGGDLEPDSSDCILGKVFKLPVSNYSVSFKRNGEVILISFVPSSKNTNKIESSVRI